MKKLVALIALAGVAGAAVALALVLIFAGGGEGEKKWAGYVGEADAVGQARAFVPKLNRWLKDSGLRARLSKDGEVEVTPVIDEESPWSDGDAGGGEAWQASWSVDENDTWSEGVAEVCVLFWENPTDPESVLSYKTLCD